VSLNDQSHADGFVITTVCPTGESYMRLTQDGSTQPRASRGAETLAQHVTPRPVDPLAGQPVKRKGSRRAV
jgi:hypothetical protein